MGEITVITPVTQKYLDVASYKKFLNLPKINYSMRGLGAGISGVNTAFDKVLIAPEVLCVAYSAAQKNTKAIIINCTIQPAFQACQELLDIPIFGITYLSMQFAADLGTKTVVLIPQFHPNYKDLLRSTITHTGYGDYCISILEIDIRNKPQAVAESLIKNQLSSIKKQYGDEISSLIIYSGYLLQFSTFIKNELTHLNYNLTLIEPLKASLIYVNEYIINNNNLYTKLLRAPSQDKVKTWLDSCE